MSSFSSEVFFFSLSAFHPPTHPVPDDVTVVSWRQVRAADRGADNLKTQQKIGISVVARPVTSLAPPHFRHTGLRESITESDKPGQLIVLLSADDADKDRLYFAITGKASFPPASYPAPLFVRLAYYCS